MWIYISSDTLHICILLFPSINMPEGWHLRNSSCQLPCSISGLKAPLCSPANGCKGSSSYWLDFSLLALTGSMNTHRAAEPGCRLGPTIGKKPQWCCFQKLHTYQHTADSSWDHSLSAKVLLSACNSPWFVLSPQLHSDTLWERVIWMLWVIKFQCRATLLGI